MRRDRRFLLADAGFRPAQNLAQCVFAFESTGRGVHYLSTGDMDFARSCPGVQINNDVGIRGAM